MHLRLNIPFDRRKSHGAAEQGKEREEFMNVFLRTAALVLFLAVSSHAADSVKEFTFTALDGRVISYRAGSSAPTVVNISAHW